MHLMNNLLLDQLVGNIEEAYREFLKVMGLEDSEVVRVGFYTAMLQLVKDDPIPRPDVQPELVRYLEKSIKDALGEDDDDFLETVKAAYQAAGEVIAAERRHNRDVIFIGVKRDDWNKWT